MTTISFFDCNATLGNPTALTYGSRFPTPDSLMKEMAKFDIDEALVVDFAAKELDYKIGNERVLSAVEDRPALHPVATIFPDYGDSEDHIEYLSRILDRGCRAARLYPNAIDEINEEYIFGRMYPFHPDVVGPICEVLQERRVPLFVEMDQVRWDEVYDICRNFPRLPMVLLNLRYRHKRSLFAGLTRYPNLHFDISCYTLYRGLEQVCRAFGPERMLFGTRLPRWNALWTIAMVMFAEIGDADKQAIAGDNLRRLLAGARA